LKKYFALSFSDLQVLQFRAVDIFDFDGNGESGDKILQYLLSMEDSIDIQPLLSFYEAE